MSTEKFHEGGCQCGAVRFRTSDQALRVLACHCKTCKQRTGADYGVGIYLNDNDVEFTKGTSQVFEFRSDESGRWIRTEFCQNCGSAISWTLELRPGVRGIAGGSYDDPNWFNVEAHIWTNSARAEVSCPDNVKAYEKGLPPA
ncbi:uncharacterized protein METZ01_LOCUS491506 [marine metagenome]|uniref:CENP-V/GFA domain-containing protein n=1 Tax=marine metagenome TaxID=408172 RepID=A0A383D2E5_9ZZZZ